MVFMVDVTAQLDQSALEFFFNSDEKLFAILSETGQVKRANIAFRRFVGPASGADGASIFSYVAKSSRNKLQIVLDATRPQHRSEEVILEFEIGREHRRLRVELCGSENEDVYFTGVDITREEEQQRSRDLADANLAQLQNLVGVGRWRHYRTGTTEWSDKMYEMHGVDPLNGPPTFEGYLQLFDLRDRRRLIAGVNRCYKTGQPVSVSCRLAMPSGEEKTLEVAGSPILDTDGAVIGIHGVSVDRTQSVRVLQSLVESSNSVRSFIDHAPLSTAVVDKDRRIVMMSKHWLEANGWREEEVLGRSVDQVWENIDDKLNKALSKALNGESVVLKKHLFKRNDGTTYWMRWRATPWKGSNGDAIAAVLSLENIDDLVHAQDDVEASQSRLQFALSMSHTMVWELDHRTGVYTADGDWRHFMDDKPGAATSIEDIFKFIHPADIDRVREKWIVYSRSGSRQPFELEHRIMMSGDEWKWVSASVRTEIDKDGTLVRTIGLLRDISKRKQHESRVQEAEQNIHAAVQSKSAFVTHLAAEVKQPLNSIHRINRALREAGLDKRNEQLTKLADASARVLEDLMSSASFYTRLEASEIEFDIAPFDLLDVVESAAENALPLHVAGQRKIRVECAPDVDGVFRGDGVRLREVLVSLLRYLAVREKAENLCLKVDIEQSDEGVSLVSLVISDQRSGLMSENSALDVLGHDHLVGAAGMPVAIARKVIHLMKGSFEVTQTNDTSREIRIDLPLSRDDFVWCDDTGEKDEFRIGGQYAGKSVLLAEDNPMKRKVLEGVLYAYGVRVDVVENGEDAVEAVKAKVYDLILMDTRMPTMNGIDATRAIREWEDGSGRQATPIIALIAKASEDEINTAHDAGCDLYLEKPVAQEALIEVLDKFFEAPVADIDMAVGFI